MAEQLRSQGRAADELHERSRRVLVEAARSGSLAGLTQREIAAAIGRSQPEVSRLLRFHGSSPLARELTRNRKAVVDMAMAHGAKNLRVFGSVALGTDDSESDIDLLVDVAPGTSLFALARLEIALGELLGADVDIVSASSLRSHLEDRVMREAIPL